MPCRFLTVLLLTALILPQPSTGNRLAHIRSTSWSEWSTQEVGDSLGMGTELVVSGGGGWRREMRQLLRREAGQAGNPAECCPTVKEMVEPDGGKNQNDMYVELFREGSQRQRFYELSCRGDILGRPCLFIDRSMRNQSRCVQQYSFTYAIVRDPTTVHGSHRTLASQFPNLTHSGWTLDYIKVRSGCACQLTDSGDSNGSSSQKWSRRRKRPKNRGGKVRKKMDET